MNSSLFAQIYEGATPTIDEFVIELGDLFPLLKLYKSTPQDPEWHAEGDVHIHTGMVLEETYRILATEATHLNRERCLSLILGALFHDIAKPLTTKQQEIQGLMRTVAPRHESKGRSYLALKLIGMGLSYNIVETVLGLVGYHHLPKLLVVKSKDAGSYLHLARLADPELLYWLELADMRGRECVDRVKQIEYIEMYGLFAKEYGAWQRNGDDYHLWQSYFAKELVSFDRDTQDLIFSNAIQNRENGKIWMPEEEIARSYSYRAEFPQLVVTVGASGAGKSTWIDRHLPDYQIISLDDLREKLGKSRADQSQNGRVLQTAKEKLKSYLRQRAKVVWDATSLRKDFREQIIDIAYKYGALVTLIVFHCPESITIDRNRQRSHTIPDWVLTKQLQTMEFPEIDEAHRVIFLDAEGEVLATYGNCQEEIIIAKAGKPLVKMIPYQEAQKARVPGGWEGKVVMSDDFDDELPANLLAGFMGEEE